jgi:O-acetyl-ADP-ribose deacetylase (regulator of RNase III)
MLIFKTGNIFESQAEALVNAANCVGVMGRGIALQFKNRFPDNYGAYRMACQRGTVGPGKMFVFNCGEHKIPKLIINFPTKRHWRDKSRMEDITLDLLDLNEVIKSFKVTSLAIPPLGAGLGGLDCKDVSGEIENKLGDLTDIKILVYKPIEVSDLERTNEK